MHKRALQILFIFILVSLTSFNLWVSTQQAVWTWGGLTTPPDNLWTIATLIDAYYGFITFCAWVLWKEARAPQACGHDGYAARGAKPLTHA